MRIEVKHECRNFDSFRAEKVKSMFNPESGHQWEHVAEIPAEGNDWQIGLIVGPSGSGKTSIGRKIWEDTDLHNLYSGWHADRPIIDDIAIDSTLSHVTASLSAVGLGDVPAWLRPFHVLSNGEQFRAGLARLICEAPDRSVVDEFTSVIDRQVATIGAAAFGRAWRRLPGKQIVLLSCHYDVADWLLPDWIYDTRTGEVKKKSSPGLLFSSTFGRSTEVTGSILKSIII